MKWIYNRKTHLLINTDTGNYFGIAEDKKLDFPSAYHVVFHTDSNFMLYTHLNESSCQRYMNKIASDFGAYEFLLEDLRKGE